MTIPTLYFDSADIHDQWREPGDFQSVLDDLVNRSQSPRLRIAVTQATFSRLDRMAAFACATIGLPAPPVPRFDVAGANKLLPGLMEYLESARAHLEPLGIAISDPESGLREILTEFDKRANPASRPNLLRLLGVLADDVFIGPHTFHLDLSNRCNTNCIFCGLHSPLLLEPSRKIRGRRFTERWKGRTVDRKIFTELVDDLHAIGTREDILFSGEGEPLTHPDAEWMIRYVKSKDLSLTLFTNGLAMNETLADLVVDAGLDILYWSLSSGTPETFAKLQPARKPADHSRMIGEMKSLVQKKRGAENKPYIILAHVINNLNFDECEKAMEIAADVGVDSVRYQIMHSCTSTESLLIDKVQFDIAKKQVDRAGKIAEQAGIEIVANIEFQMSATAKTFELPETVLPCHWSHDLYNKTGCLAGWFFSRSFTDGRISFCCHDKIVGNLNRTRFKDLWFSDHYRNIRRKAKAFDESHNIDLTDESCGGMLLDKDCAYCGNYEFINQALLDLENLGWKKYLLRKP